MSRDFERNWHSRLSAHLDRAASPETRRFVMEGCEELCDATDRRRVCQWTRLALERLEQVLDAEDLRRALVACSCTYPCENLAELRKHYAVHRDLNAVHEMLRKRFRAFLEGDLALQPDLVNEILSRDWGLAGRREGDMIVATKIPKSGNLKAYFSETDPRKRRELYCYCGAGFYKQLWEEILMRPVQVDVRRSLLTGDEVCSFVIHLPVEDGGGKHD